MVDSKSSTFKVSEVTSDNVIFKHFKLPENISNHNKT